MIFLRTPAAVSLLRCNRPACISGRLVHHSGKVESWPQLKQIHVQAVQHAHKLWRSAWVRPEPQLTHHTRLTDLWADRQLLTSLHESSWTRRTTTEQAPACQAGQGTKPQVPKPMVPLPGKLAVRGHAGCCGRNWLILEVQFTVCAGWEYHTAPVLHLHPVQ
jgi:hypothetical protein